ncbi:S41 family peptidase [Shivajiella indica]|uniref:S41 family peptidase n=1 Tax=Shivajiella indica TaxID=872115 RepID=A0ABW5BB61_9BACT
MNKLRLNIWGILLAIVLIFPACNPESDDVEPIKVQNAVQKAIFDSMKEWYYWTSEIPDDVDLSGSLSNEDLLEKLRYAPLDRPGWTYLTTRAQFEAAFTGQVSGVHGFRLALDENENLFVASVLPNGPAGRDGWQRGWEFIEINGRSISSYRNSNGSYSFDLGPNTVGVQNTFKLKLPDGTETTRTIAKESFQANSVIFEDVFEANGKKVGYWVYESFRATSGLTPVRSQEVENSFNFFISEGIDELIIDLRYNGGGSVDVAAQVLNYLVPQSASNSPSFVYRYNGNKIENNRTINFSKIGSLNLSRVVFITSRSSASSSELIINSLSPYMEVVLIGANTYGKPVGQFPLSQFNRTLRENDVEVVPVTFSIANANGRADYFDGLEANFLVGDDFTKNWGDPEEARLAAALNFISTGAVSSRLASTYYEPIWEMIDSFKGLEKEFPIY